MPTEKSGDYTDSALQQLLADNALTIAVIGAAVQTLANEKCCSFVREAAEKYLVFQFRTPQDALKEIE